MGPHLSLFGVVHVDRPGKVADELEMYVAEADAVFEEWPAERPDRRTAWRIAASFPPCSSARLHSTSCTPHSTC